MLSVIFNNLFICISNDFVNFAEKALAAACFRVADEKLKLSNSFTVVIIYRDKLISLTF
jgi:hypothetical protein